MIKKYMNQLYKEIEQIRRKIDGGHLKYFGCKDFGNALCYTVVLKNGSYFYITLGTKYIPNIKKKDIAFILKEQEVNSLMPNWGKWFDSVDTDRGRTRHKWSNGNTELQDFEKLMFKKYRVNVYKEVDTGSWD